MYLTVCVCVCVKNIDGLFCRNVARCTLTEMDLMFDTYLKVNFNNYADADNFRGNAANPGAF